MARHLETGTIFRAHFISYDLIEEECHMPV